jgi:hypothetical protein
MSLGNVSCRKVQAFPNSASRKAAPFLATFASCGLLHCPGTWELRRRYEEFSCSRMLGRKLKES